MCSSYAHATCRNTTKVARKFKTFTTSMAGSKRKACTHHKKGVCKKHAKRGRKHALSKRHSRSAYLLLLRYSARQVANILRRRPGVPRTLSKNTVISSAKAYGESIGKPIQCDKKKPQQKLRENCKRARVTFCKAMKRRNWANVMFTDRKRFYLLYPGSKVQPSMWVLKGERQQAYKASKPICLNVYLGITCHGPTKCHFVAGTTGRISKFKTKAGNTSRSICSSEYYHVVHKTFLPCGDLLFHCRPWVLQQDGDRSHASAHAALRRYLVEHPKSHITMLDGWPPCSPDLSVIENFWGWLQAKINMRGCRTVASFKKCLLRLIRTAPFSLFEDYYKSIPKRLRECIDKGGSRTHY